MNEDFQVSIKWVLIESFFFTAFDLGGLDFDDGFNRNWFGNSLGIKKLDQTTIETLSEILLYHNKGKLFLQIKHASLFHLIFLSLIDYLRGHSKTMSTWFCQFFTTHLLQVNKLVNKMAHLTIGVNNFLTTYPPLLVYIVIEWSLWLLMRTF